MTDEGHLDGAGDGGQDVCTFFASFINQRVQVERLLNWLRESQTACTDSNCFDEINGMPGTEQGGSLLGPDDSTQYEDEQGPFALVMCLVLGLLTVYAMALSRNRDRDELQDIKSKRSGDGGPPSPGDDHNGFRRNGGRDDQGRPTI